MAPTTRYRKRGSLAGLSGMTYRPQPDVRALLDRAVTDTGRSKNAIIDDALRAQLPDVGKVRS